MVSENQPPFYAELQCRGECITKKLFCTFVVAKEAGFLTNIAVRVTAGAGAFPSGRRARDPAQASSSSCQLSNCICPSLTHVLCPLKIYNYFNLTPEEQYEHNVFYM